MARRTNIVLGLSGVGLLGLMLAGSPPTSQAIAAPPPGDASGEDAPEVAAAAEEASPTSEPTFDPIAAEGPLAGMPGAATALAIHDYPLAESLAAAAKSDVEGSAAVALGALRGRALLRAGKAKDAVEVLSPLWETRRVERDFPKELLGMELATAKVAWARDGSLSVADADKQLASAISILGKVRKGEPIRNFAAVRVKQAEAMLYVQGTSASSTRNAGRKAAAAMAKIIKDYPYHPRVGEFWLEQSKAMARGGKVREAAAELRRISIQRAGEPEAEQAWQELERLAASSSKASASPLSVGERLEKAESARRLRWVDLSRQILDDIIDDPKMREVVKRQARSSRAYTAYKQRDFKRCVDDLKPGYERTGNYELRGRVLRCLERGAFYDEAIQIWESAAKASKRKGMASAARWDALQLAVRAGKYGKAESLLKQYEANSKGHPQTRRWLRAWLPMRLGRADDAIAGFAEVAKRDRSERSRANYFRGKLLVSSDDATKQAEGVTVLTELIERDPLKYYALQARNRLLEAEKPVPEPPSLSPVADEAVHPTRAQTQSVFDALDAEFGAAWPPIRRGAQLYRAGWIEEARREVRVAVQVFETRGSKSGGPRSESIHVGLGWKGDWSYPRVFPTRAGNKQLRDRDAKARFENGLRELARGVDEPYRVAKLSNSSHGASKARWHPRAYRAAIEREARLRGVDPIHMWSLMYTESRFRRFVVSPVGARGALQVMPWTGRQLAVLLDEFDGTFDNDSLFDIDTNAHLAGYYVAELLRKFQGQAPMAYASYNGGPSNVARWLTAKHGAEGAQPLELDVFVEEIAFSESYRYTKRVTEVSAAYALMYEGELPRWKNTVDPKVEDNIWF